MDQQEELKAHLMATDEEYRRLATEHSGYARKLDDLEALPHLSMEEEVEDSLGSEWFMTSPARIERWYTSFQAALAQLGASEEPG